MNELRSCDTQDIVIDVVDGLNGFLEGITAEFRDTLVRTCIVLLICYSMQFASWKELSVIVVAFKPISRAENAQAAASYFEAIDQGLWGRIYPAIA
jgi:putative transposase